MTIDEVLQGITILKDCTSVNLFAVLLILLGLAEVSFFVSCFIMRFSESFLREKIRIIILTVICILGVILNGWFYMERPVFINFYISPNDIEIPQLATFFNVSGINTADGMIVCHIVPKSEFYDDLITYWMKNEGILL